MKYMYGESFLSGRISPENEIELEEKVSGKRKTPAKGVIYRKKRVIGQNELVFNPKDRSDTN